MNKLLEYLSEHYHPGGSAVRFAKASEIMENTGFTVKEIHLMSMEAYREDMLVFARCRVKDGRWGIDRMIPGDIEFLAVTRKALKMVDDKRIKGYPKWVKN